EVVHAEWAGRGCREQRRRLVLADPVVGDAVPAVDHLLVRGVENLERGHDLAGGERLDLDLPAGELVDPLGEHLEVVLQREAGRPGRLELVVLRRRLLGRGTTQSDDERGQYERRFFDAHNFSSPVVEKKESPARKAAISCRPALPYPS